MRFRVDYGCSDGNCVFRMAAPPAERGGMHTNGGCRCLHMHGLTAEQREELQSIKRGVHSMAERIRLAENAKTDTDGSGNGRG